MTILTDKLLITKQAPVPLLPGDTIEAASVHGRPIEELIEELGKAGMEVSVPNSEKMIYYRIYEGERKKKRRSRVPLKTVIPDSAKTLRIYLRMESGLSMTLSDYRDTIPFQPEVVGSFVNMTKGARFDFRYEGNRNEDDVRAEIESIKGFFGKFYS